MVDKIEEIVDQFIESDPILGERSKNKLVDLGAGSLDVIISRFGSLKRTATLKRRLGQLFSHFGSSSVDRLVAVLRTNDWHKMVDASYCFCGLDVEPAGSILSRMISEKDQEVDILRCSIDALGYLGAREYSYVILNIFSFDSSGLSPVNEEYLWDKLSNNIFLALLRMAASEDKVKAHSAYGFPDLERFYEIAGKLEFEKLIRSNAYSISLIFCDFKPKSADTILQKWIRSPIPFFQDLGLEAISGMRLKRMIPALKSYMHSLEEDSKMCNVARVLAEIQSSEAAQLVGHIFSSTDEASEYFKSISLQLAICLDRIEDRLFVELVYPSLLKMGGEIAAHTYYNLGLMGFDESIWAVAANSEDFIIRASVAPVYAQSKKNQGVSKLLEMERESSQSLELLIILSSLINAGYVRKKDDFLRELMIIDKTTDYRTLRYTWRREVISALRVIADPNSLVVWENLFGLESAVVVEELASITHKNIVEVDLQIQEETSIKGRQSVEPKNIFISYSSADIKLKNELLKYLSSLSNQGYLTVWHDEEIVPGIWNDQIDKAMESADVFILLVTQNFLNSEFIRLYEIPKAYSKFKEGKAKIFPIICETCTWEIYPISTDEKEFNKKENRLMAVSLGKLQVFPRRAKPIRNWRYRQDAFTDIINQLKKYL